MITTDLRRCTRCEVHKPLPAFANGSTVCSFCRRRNRDYKRGLLEICSSVDGQRWHVRGPMAARTVCGLVASTLGQRPCVNVPNGPGGTTTTALMILRRDAGCCERCRTKLAEVFQ